MAGEAIHHIAHSLNAENPPEFITIKCMGVSRPIVIPSAEVAAANQRIMTKNGIYKPSYLGDSNTAAR